MEAIYPKLVELFEKDLFAVLATMIHQAGSAPRAIGTKLLIAEDGSSFGTIGGGLLEARVLEAAQRVFTDRSPRRLVLSLEGGDVAETDMLCGGDVEVFLEPVFPHNLYQLHLFERVVEVSRRGGAGLLVTMVDQERWGEGKVPKIFLEPDGRKWGSLLGIQKIEDFIAAEMPRIINQKESRMLIFKDDEGRDIGLFVEPVTANPILYVFGGGHISMQIVPLASLVEFKVIVIDDRPEFADRERFPDAAEVHHHPFEGVLEKFRIDEASYLVIMTRGHIHDKTVLSQALKTRARYIGMIGSRRKKDIVYHSLLEEGLTQEDLDRVHFPIGMAIGAETPAEIAVSIVAELIRVRAGIEVK
jgi:xanthine dehydrogenase accessory factor